MDVEPFGWDGDRPAIDRCDRFDACMLDRRCASYEVCKVVMDDRRDYAEEAENRRLQRGGDVT